MKLRRPWFAAPYLDEMALAERADAVLDHLPGPLPSRDDYLGVAKNGDFDLAAMVFYRALRRLNQNFLNRLRELPDRPFKAASNGRILIVPGLFYRERPEIGGSGALIQGIARRCGLSASIIPIASTGTVAANAQQIAAAVAANGDSPVWLVSMSKGSADVRYYLQCLVKQPPPVLRGWINVSGIPAGTPLADRRLRHPLQRWALRTLCALCRFDYRAIEEMRASNPLWQAPLHLPATFRVIHVVGIPLLCHVSQPLLRRYRQMRTAGPTDGMVDLLTNGQLPGDVLPLLGADHFLRHSQLCHCLYRLCALIDVLTMARNGIPKIQQRQHAHTPTCEFTERGTATTAIGGHHE